MANILAQPLIELAPLLAASARPGAALALGGVLASQSAEVQAAYAENFALALAGNEDGWTLLCGVRR